MRGESTGGTMRRSMQNGAGEIRYPQAAIIRPIRRAGGPGRRSPVRLAVEPVRRIQQLPVRTAFGDLHSAAEEVRVRDPERALRAVEFDRRMAVLPHVPAHG